MYPFEAARPDYFLFWLLPVSKDVSYFLLLACTAGPLILLCCWYLPELFGLVADWIRGRDLLAESEADRRLEGRLFDPAFMQREVEQKAGPRSS